MAEVPPEHVLDASALGRLFLNEPESDAFRRWYRDRIEGGTPFAAPDLLGYEIAQLVAKNFPRLSDSEFRSRVRQPIDGIALRPAFEDLGPFLEGLTAYDASYLAVAASAGATLVTYDRRLRRAAERRGVQVEAPGEVHKARSGRSTRT